MHASTMQAPKSPFPGFDPYVQPFWRDVHAALIVYTRERLNPGLPGDLRARIEERRVVEKPFDQPTWQRDVVPDLFVVERKKGSSWRGRGENEEGGLAVADPIEFKTLAQPTRETYIEIIEPGAGGRVVTVIEFLSPTNKTPGEGMDMYLTKQREYRRAGLSLVEIDLVRGGKHVLALPKTAVPEKMEGWPLICVCEGWQPTLMKFYPLDLRKRIPNFAVPLRETDAQVALDLQTVFDRCFEVGEYGLDIDYREDPKHPLSAGEAAWADALLREKGLRP